MVCYGEVLWDCGPEGNKPGGAPMNVAYHLRKLGVDATMISRVGDDADGTKLLDLLEDWGFPLGNVGIDSQYPTSKVDLTVAEDNEVSYVIHENVAWDYIPLTDHDVEAVKKSGILVFGSLASRNPVSHQSLLKLMDAASIKVMDINIRMPFFTMEKMMDILERVTILKLNKAELNEVVDALDTEVLPDEDVRVKYLQQRFKIDEVLLTKGSKGAVYYLGEQRFYQPAYSIQVKDTVGSGDAFLAGFLARRFDGKSHTAQEVIGYAAAVGGFNTTKEGACPDYTLEELDVFLEQQ